jgi:hypothetical protein
VSGVRETSEVLRLHPPHYYAVFGRQAAHASPVQRPEGFLTCSLYIVSETRGGWLIFRDGTENVEGFSRLFAKIPLPRGCDDICRGGARMTDTGDIARTSQSDSGGVS